MARIALCHMVQLLLPETKCHDSGRRPVCLVDRTSACAVLDRILVFGPSRGLKMAEPPAHAHPTGASAFPVNESKFKQTTRGRVRDDVEEPAKGLPASSITHHHSPVGTVHLRTKEGNAKY
jgi:hypothetical protein